MLPTKENPFPVGFSGEFYQMLNKELISIFLNLLQKIF